MKVEEENEKLYNLINGKKFFISLLIFVLSYLCDMASSKMGVGEKKRESKKREKTTKESKKGKENKEVKRGNSLWVC